MFMRKLKIKPNIGRSVKTPQSVIAAIASGGYGVVSVAETVQEQNSQNEPERIDETRIVDHENEKLKDADTISSEMDKSKSPTASSENVNDSERYFPMNSVTQRTETSPRKELIAFTQPVTPTNKVTQMFPDEDSIITEQICNISVAEDDDSSINQDETSHGLKRNRPEGTRGRRWYVKEKKPPERNKMTMMDLIYWNPADNRMKTPIKKHVEQKKEPVEKPKEKDFDEVEEAMPAPRLKIGEDGQIILDEESLVIHHAVPDSMSVITEDSETTYFSFRNRLLSKKWSLAENALFYKALTVVGTDFSLMAELLQGRSRHELKLKFKREEKKDRAFIDRILGYSNTYGLKEFREELDDYYKKLSAKNEAQIKTKNGKRGRPKKKDTDSEIGDADETQSEQFLGDNENECNMSSTLGDVDVTMPNETKRKRGRPKKSAIESVSTTEATKGKQKKKRKKQDQEDEVHVEIQFDQIEQDMTDCSSESVFNSNIVESDESNDFVDPAEMEQQTKRSTPKKSKKVSENSSANNKKQKCEKVALEKDSLNKSNAENDAENICDPIILNSDPTTLNIITNNPENLVLVSESGERLTFEVVFEEAAVNSIDEPYNFVSQLIDSTEDPSSSVCVKTEKSDDNSNVGVPSSINLTNDPSTKYSTNRSEDSHKSDAKCKSPNPKRKTYMRKKATVSKAALIRKKVSTEIKEAIRAITDAENSEPSSYPASSDIAAYETVQMQKIGRKWLQVSESPRKAKYTDFTVTESDCHQMEFVDDHSSTADVPLSESIGYNLW